MMKTIAWDIDDVLNDLMRSWLHSAWLPGHPGCRVRYEDLRKNPPHEILGTTKAEYLESLDAFRLSAAVAEMLPDDRVLRWFAAHGERCRHVAVTAVPLNAASASAAWVMRHFGRWIRSFQLVPSPRQGQCQIVYDRSKGEAIGRWRQIDIFIDDDDANLASVRGMGIRTLQVPRPWNGCTMRLEEVLDRLTEWTDGANTEMS